MRSDGIADSRCPVFMRTSATQTPEPTPPARVAAGAAHDLRNILFVVSAHCHRMLAEASADHPWAEDLHAIREATDRCTELARQIVDEARLLEQPSVPLDVNAVVRGVEPLITQIVGDGIALRSTLATNAWPVTANTVQIEQILMNLAVNARDAMPQGGTLTLATENRTVTAVAPEAPSHFVVLSVSDTGTGIDPAVQERMFEPYFTTKATQGGSGIGLATVRTIALRYGGQIEVSTAPGAGTTIRVVLPRAVSHVPPPPLPERAEPGRAPSPAGGLRVVLAEAERPARDLLAQALREAGHQVREAGSGAEAIGWSSVEGPIDLLVVSLFLPDVNGLETATRVRDRWPDAGVIFLSDGFDPLDDLPPAVPVLSRPFTAGALTAAIATVTGAQRLAA